MLRVLGTGRLGNDPELREVQGGKKITSFSFYQLNGKEEEPPVTTVAFGKNAEILAKYCNAGDKIAINAHISTKKYTTQSGEKRQSFEIWIDSFEFLTNARAKAEDKPIDEGLPF